MKFKEMALEMTQSEIQRCMSILIEDSIVQGVERVIEENYIIVTYKVIGDNRKKAYTITLLADSIDDIEYSDQLRGDAEYLYRQYLIAKGYSDFWKGNMFVEE